MLNVRCVIIFINLNISKQCAAFAKHEIVQVSVFRITYLHVYNDRKYSLNNAYVNLVMMIMVYYRNCLHTFSGTSYVHIIIVNFTTIV